MKGNGDGGGGGGGSGGEAEEDDNDAATAGGRWQAARLPPKQLIKVPIVRLRKGNPRRACERVAARAAARSGVRDRRLL